MDARHLNHQLPPVAGLRQRDVTDMVFGVDLALVDPVGPIEPERRCYEAAAKDLGTVQPPREEVQTLLEADLAAGRG